VLLQQSLLDVQHCQTSSFVYTSVQHAAGTKPQLVEPQNVDYADANASPTTIRRPTMRPLPFPL
jgi:hypothetical protein